MSSTAENLYKYRIKELFIKFFGCQASMARKEFSSKYQYALITIKRDFNALLTDPYRIPEERLKQYSEYLNVERDALRNSFYQKLTA